MSRDDIAVLYGFYRGLFVAGMSGAEAMRRTCDAFAGLTDSELTVVARVVCAGAYLNAGLRGVLENLRAAGLWSDRA